MPYHQVSTGPRIGTSFRSRARREYLDGLGCVVLRERPDAVLIGTDTELSILSRHRSELEAAWGTRIVVSAPEVIDIADDKYRTFQFLGGRGFPVPQSCLPGDEEGLIERVGFPLIVKPRVGARAVGLHVVHDRDQLRRATAGVEGLVIQEHIGDSAHEFTASVIVFDGCAHASIVMRRDLRDGNTYRAFVEEFPSLNAEVRRMGEALDAFGPANFQFRLDAAGHAVVFEINARFSGTTPLRHLVGFPEVDMVLRHVLLGEPVVQPRVVPSTLLRHWEETVISPEMAAPVLLEMQKNP